MDPQTQKIDAELMRLEAAKAAREALLADPEYRRIRKLYENLADAINALDDAGERPADSEGYAIHIVGKSFSTFGDGVEENNERWKRHMRSTTRTR
jgi:hypothetical protein